MTQTILHSIVQFIGLVVGVPVSLPHQLNLNNIPTKPKLGATDAAGFTVTADTVNVTVTRTTGGASVNVYVETWHSIEDLEPPGSLDALIPFFVSNGGSGGGGAGGWTDDGAVVRLTTITDQVVVGALLPAGSALFSIIEAASKWFAVGSTDAFARRQIWFTETSSVFRLGADVADGDAFSADSEGIVVYHPSTDNLGRMKADRFALTRASDSSLNYFRVDETSLFYRADPPGGAVWFKVDRATGKISVSEAANGMAGIAVLNGVGTLTIANTRVTASTRFLLTAQDGGPAPTGVISQTARVVGASFTITSSLGAADAGVNVYYQLWEPS